MNLKTVFTILYGLEYFLDLYLDGDLYSYGLKQNGLTHTLINNMVKFRDIVSKDKVSGFEQKARLDRANERKETAVEWIQWSLEHTILTHEQIMQTIGLFEQAKEIEKQQITTFTADWSVQYKYEDGKSINAYYDETFGGNK